MNPISFAFPRLLDHLHTFCKSRIHSMSLSVKDRSDPSSSMVDVRAQPCSETLAKTVGSSSRGRLSNQICHEGCMEGNDAKQMSMSHLHPWTTDPSNVVSAGIVPNQSAVHDTAQPA